jgi:hypothetical protein
MTGRKERGRRKAAPCGSETDSDMGDEQLNNSELWRLIVVGGHTRKIGKTQLVCDVIQSFPKVNWIAGKITHYELGADAQNVNVEAIGGAPTEQLCALEWETQADTNTDSARFLAAGAKRFFWLRTQEKFLSEGVTLLKQALREVQAELDPTEKNALIVESNSLLPLLKPSLYFAVLDPDREDFTETSKTALERANALVLRGEDADGDGPPAPLWMKVPAQLLQQRPSVLQRLGEPLPRPLESLIQQMLDDPPGVAL